MGEVYVGSFTCWEVSVSVFFGKTPKVRMVCGGCSFKFSERFLIDRLVEGEYPRVKCPSCGKVNIVPLVIVD